MHKSKHPYHLVDPSPWPLLTALALMLTVLGVVLRLHSQLPYLWWLGLLGVGVTSSLWWRDIIAEKSHHTPKVVGGLRMGMIYFIISEVCFFAAFFAAFFYVALFPNEATGFQWPPKGIQTFDPFDLPYFNTLLLLLSGAVLTWSHLDLIEGQVKQASTKLLLTVCLGLAFTVVQAYEYHHAAFAMKDGIYPSTFFLTTGFHGVHVIVGTVFLLVIWARMRRGHMQPHDHMGFEAAAWYWHFVDVVWLFLFVFLYIWGG